MKFKTRLCLAAMCVALLVGAFAVSTQQTADATAFFSYYQTIDVTSDAYSVVYFYDFGSSTWSWTDIILYDYAAEFYLPYGAWFAAIVYDFDTLAFEEIVWFDDENW